jgi:L-alanine-DL-glutamate epimerase-like enolase superfamily enzyme
MPQSSTSAANRQTTLLVAFMWGAYFLNYCDRQAVFAMFPVLQTDLLAVKAQGFRAFKIGWGPFGRSNKETDEMIVRTAREAVGAECRLMVDAGGSDAHWPNGYKWALNTAEMLAEYDVFWFEEALVPDALEDYAKLREHSPVPIAGGEVLTRRQAFAPWLEARAFDIVQPDVTKCGGLSEERRIAWMAQEHGVRFIPHGWNTAVGLAADLQLASAFAGTDLVEYLTGSPFIDEIAEGGWQLDHDGMLPIPDKPGLGLTLNRDALAKYTRGEKLL